MWDVEPIFRLSGMYGQWGVADNARADEGAMPQSALKKPCMRSIASFRRASLTEPKQMRK